TPFARLGELQGGRKSLRGPSLLVHRKYTQPTGAFSGSHSRSRRQHSGNKTYQGQALPCRNQQLKKGERNRDPQKSQETRAGSHTGNDNACSMADTSLQSSTDTDMLGEYDLGGGGDEDMDADLAAAAELAAEGAEVEEADETASAA
ncbi:unnamed protein product, partial [Scytosiphon promiscuus]